MISVRGKTLQLIAEVKTHSPFGWSSDKSWDELFEIANRVGDIISIHTDPRWNGSFELVKKARSLSAKPILAKGIHETDDLIEKAIEAGADYVLAVGRIPKVHMEKCMIEPLTLAELASYAKAASQDVNTIAHVSTIDASTLKIVWNSRDLKTGGVKQETFDEARAIFNGWLCQASNIRTIGDVNEKADAVLVGTHLEEFAVSISQVPQLS